MELSAVQSLPQQLQQQMQQPQPVGPSLRCGAAEEPAAAGSSDSGSGATSGPDAGLSKGSLHDFNGIEEGVGRQEHQPQHRADWAAPGRGFAGGWPPPCTWFLESAHTAMATPQAEPGLRRCCWSRLLSEEQCCSFLADAH